MARKIIWTDSAWDDLGETFNYISKDSLFYAKAFIKEIKKTARTLSLFPERGRTVPQLNNDSIKEIFIRNYRLVYKITTKNIYILGFIHEAKDLSLVWDREREK